MSDTVYEVVNTIGQEGRLETSEGDVNIDSTGDVTLTDEGQADEIKDKYPYLEVVKREQYSKTHPMRVSQWPGVPWHQYDELGRIINGNLDTQSPAPEAGGQRVSE